MTEIQQKLLEMLNWFHNYCVERKLRYYIIEGTVIGAIRHEGFIPWDDDIDVGMPRQDYDLLLSCAKEMNSKYLFETPYSENKDYICPWTKLYDTTTTKIEKSRHNAKFGIYIDIFPLDGLGMTIGQSLKWFKRIDRLNMLWATRVCAIRKGRGFTKNAAIICSRIVPQWIINDKKLVKRIDSVCKTYNYDEADYVACTLSTYREKEIMKKEVYGEPTLYKFENLDIYGPELATDYLSIIYGDWKELPPKEKRVSQHDYLYLNLNEPYIGNNEK